MLKTVYKFVKVKKNQRSKCFVSDAILILCQNATKMLKVVTCFKNNSKNQKFSTNHTKLLPQTTN